MGAHKFVIQIFAAALKFEMPFTARNKPPMERSIALLKSGDVITAS
jgi:hypothetical protein